MTYRSSVLTFPKNMLQRCFLFVMLCSCYSNSASASCGLGVDIPANHRCKSEERYHIVKDCNRSPQGYLPVWHCVQSRLSRFPVHVNLDAPVYHSGQDYAGTVFTPAGNSSAAVTCVKVLLVPPPCSSAHTARKKGHIPLHRPLYPRHEDRPRHFTRLHI